MRITDGGGLRSQFSHVNDITPTILDATGLTMPEKVNGATQLPLNRGSLLPTFRDEEAPEHNRTQLFEVNGNRAIYHDGWLASARHSTLPWAVGMPAKKTPFENDTWELYHLDEDFSQARDVAQQRPEKLQAMQQKFREVAERLGILPLRKKKGTHLFPLFSAKKWSGKPDSTFSRK